jgi:hypothetical protein
MTRVFPRSIITGGFFLSLSLLRASSQLHPIHMRAVAAILNALQGLRR